jgi:hypothetical protein
MQGGIWSSLTCSLRLWGFGQIKIQAPGTLFYETRWLWRYLCQQDTALCSRCRTAEWMKQRAAQKIDNNQSAWVTGVPTLLYSNLWRDVMSPSSETSTLHMDMTYPPKCWSVSTKCYCVTCHSYKDKKWLSHHLIHLTFNRNTGQCCLIKSISLSSERLYTVLRWSFELNRALATAKNWHLEGCMLSVKSYVTLSNHKHDRFLWN